MLSFGAGSLTQAVAVGLGGALRGSGWDIIVLILWGIVWAIVAISDRGIPHIYPQFNYTQALAGAVIVEILAFALDRLILAP